MNIVSKLGKLLTKSVKTHISAFTSPSTETVRAGNNLPELLASKDQEAGDNYEHKRKEENNIYKEESKANKKALRAKYNVNRYENGWYSVKNFFRDQDIISKLERENKINEQSDIDDIKESARQYFRDEIGIGKGYSTEKLKKNSEKVTKQFILQITHLPEEQRKELIEIYSSVIGELDADIRADLAKDFIGIAESDNETNYIAKSLAKNAEYNLTNQDALGCIMKQTDAVDYQNATFSNMDENGINEILNSLGLRAEGVKSRIKELKSKPLLSPSEAEELKKLELINSNYVLPSYSGAMSGVPSNRYVNNDFVDTCLQEICKQAQQLEILDNVLDLTRKYLKEHPEAAQEIINRRNTDFDSLIEKVMLKRSEVWTANQRNTRESTNGTNSTISTTKARPQSITPDNVSENRVTVPIYTSSENRLLAAWNNKTPSYGKNNGVDKESLTYNVNTFKEDGESKQYGDSTPEECQKAMQMGVEEYLKYEKENQIGLIESCVNILNYSQADKNLKQLALTRFETLISKNNQKVIFKNRIHTTSGQIALEQIMDTDDIASVKTFNSSYAKEYAERRINEEK